MQLDVYNTHMELYPYMHGDYPVIEKMYTAEHNFTHEEFPCGYIIQDKKLYLPRGTPVSKIENITGASITYIQESDPMEKMTDIFSPLVEPRDHLQEESIQFLQGESNHQLALNLKMGYGKTFCVSYASTQLNVKTIIIVPNEGLKTQWIQTYHKMFTYRPKHLMNIAGSQIIEGIMNDEIEQADVYFVNHATLRNYMTEHGGHALHNFFKKIKVGIKVYDESHLEFANILLIDHFTNTNRTWYLTATFDRSDKTESRCFKLAFNHMIAFGEVESEKMMRKHVIYHVVDFNSRPSIKNRRQVIGWRGLSAASYGKYAFFDDANDTAYNVIRIILEKITGIDGKIMIFVPLIDAIDEVVKKLKREQKERSVAPYHSRISKDEKESAKKKDIIVTTIKSCGTGQDIPGLRAVICLEPIASKVVAAQMIGRLREYAKDKDTYFFDCIDRTFAPLSFWHRARMKKIETLVKQTVYLNLDE